MSCDEMNKEHLSQEQIHEFLRSHVDEDVLPRHAHDCEACHQLFVETTELFTQIKQTADLSPENDIWSKIEAQHKHEQHENKHRIKNWSFATIAASLLLIIGLQWNGLNQDRSIQNRIQVAIMQSQQLEKHLINQQRFEQASFGNNVEVTSQISELDQAIQQAYLSNKAPEVILALWNKRVKALIRLSEEPKAEPSIEFI